MDMSLKCNLITTANPVKSHTSALSSLQQTIFELESYAGAGDQLELESKYWKSPHNAIHCNVAPTLHFEFGEHTASIKPQRGLS